MSDRKFIVQIDHGITDGFIDIDSFQTTNHKSKTGKKYNNILSSIVNHFKKSSISCPISITTKLLIDGEKIYKDNDNIIDYHTFRSAYGVSQYFVGSKICIVELDNDINSANEVIFFDQNQEIEKIHSSLIGPWAKLIISVWLFDPEFIKIEDNNIIISSYKFLRKIGDESDDLYHRSTHIDRIIKIPLIDKSHVKTNIGNFTINEINMITEIEPQKYEHEEETISIIDKSVSVKIRKYRILHLRKITNSAELSIPMTIETITNYIDKNAINYKYDLVSNNDNYLALQDNNDIYLIEKSTIIESTDNDICMVLEKLQKKQYFTQSKFVKHNIETFVMYNITKNDANIHQQQTDITGIAYKLE